MTRLEKEMKKTLRVTTEMRFINNRQQFTIHDLMLEFNISRSTAIRDIAEIQELGLPLTSIAGHNGGYYVLHNQTLPAVSFTPTEIQALFVAFMATANQQLPYLRNRQAITEKLLAIVSERLQKELLNLADLLWFEDTNPDAPNIMELTDQAPVMLNYLIKQAVKYRQFVINYQKPSTDRPKWHEVYVMHFYNSQTHWYMECFDLTRNAKRTFRVDRVKEIKDTGTPNPLEIEQKLGQLRLPTNNVILELGPVAIERFRRLHQPGRRLAFTDPFQQRAIFTDYVDTNEAGMNMFIDWLFFLGDDVVVRKMPVAFQTLISKKIQKWV